MSPNRVVALLAPIVAALNSALFNWLALHAPLFNVIPRASLDELSIAVALATIATAWKWLHGWQLFEEFDYELDLVLARGAGPAGDGALSDPGVLER